MRKFAVAEHARPDRCYVIHERGTFAGNAVPSLLWHFDEPFGQNCRLPSEKQPKRAARVSLRRVHVIMVEQRVRRKRSKNVSET